MLNTTIRAVLRSSTFRDGLAKLSLDPAESSPSEFPELIASDTQRCALSFAAHISRAAH